MTVVQQNSQPYIECGISQTKNGTFYAKIVLMSKNQRTTTINMAVLGKNRLFLYFNYLKTNNMGIGGIVIATIFLCIGFLILAEIQERYL